MKSETKERLIAGAITAALVFICGVMLGAVVLLLSGCGKTGRPATRIEHTAPDSNGVICYLWKSRGALSCVKVR